MDISTDNNHSTASSSITVEKWEKNITTSDVIGNLCKTVVIILLQIHQTIILTSPSLLTDNCRGRDAYRLRLLVHHFPIPHSQRLQYEFCKCVCQFLGFCIHHMIDPNQFANLILV